MSDEAWAEAFEDLRRRPELFVRAGMMRRRKDAVARVAPALLQTTAAAVHASAADLHEVTCDPALYESFLSLPCPASYVFGDYHDNTAFCARLRRDGARVEVVHRAGHLMMLDNPEGFYAIVGSGSRGSGTGP
jgi:pimeloyl-ACP methyl ester carboxylesterase